MSVEWVEIGPCRLYCGDCLDVSKQIEQGTVDAVITSPPYNCGKDYGEDGDRRADYWAWLEDRMHSCANTLAAHGYICVNHGNFIGSRETREYVPDELRPMLDRLMPFVDLVIWDKGPPNGAAWGNFRTSPRLRANHENIFIHGGCSPMPESDIEWSDWSAFTTSVWKIPTTGVDCSIHPAMMPVEVARRLSLLYSPRRGVILDPFMGSGTTGIACVKTGRRFIGIEKEPKYFDIACRRIERAVQDSKCDLFREEKAAVETQREMF